MSAARGVLAVATADFLERVRRHRTLVTTAVLVFAAHGFLPPLGARYITMQLDDYRALYGSAYVGTLCAILCNAFLSLAGFYVVKDAVDRDRTTRVGEILASTPLSRLAYVLGKWLSNVALLAAMLAVVAIAAGVLQLMRAEDTQLDLLALVLPFAILALPVMAVTAALAVAFEVTPILRGGIGNVVYFFVWTALISTGSFGPEGRGVPAGADLVGFSAVLPSLYDAQARAYPGTPARRDQFSAGVNFKKDATWRPKTFTWTGARWTGGIVARRLVWVGVAIALVIACSRWFDRFRGPAHARPAWRPAVLRPAPALPAVDAAPAPAHLTPLSPAARRVALAPLVAGEFALLVRGTTRWWWVPVAGLTIASLLAPPVFAREWAVLLLWIWPLLMWSALGARDQRHGALELTLAAPRPVLRPVLAAWLAGTALALLVAAGPIVRLLLAGSVAPLAGLLAGACFIPALALALGTWSGSGKLFEVLYLLLWYMATNRVPALDYTGSSPEALPLVWAAAAAVLLAIALAGRARLLVRG